jgi:hypothetical protein
MADETMVIAIKVIGTQRKEVCIYLKSVPRVGDLISTADGVVYGVKDVVWKLADDRSLARVVLHCTRGTDEP